VTGWKDIFIAIWDLVASIEAKIRSRSKFLARRYSVVCLLIICILICHVYVKKFLTNF